MNITVHALRAYAPMNPDGTATYNTLKNNYSIGDGQFAMLLDGDSKGAKDIHEFSGRYDGTSKYKSGMRYGFFPSVSAGWRISEEKFFAGAKDAVNNLKIRASYGTLGNQLSGSNYYPYMSTMGR